MSKDCGKDTTLCAGCRNNYYNGKPNCGGSNECWSLPTAKVVRRWRIYWWTAPTVPGAYTEVETYDCHHQPGQYGFEKTLPDFAVEPKRLETA